MAKSIVSLWLLLARVEVTSCLCHCDLACCRTICRIRGSTTETAQDMADQLGFQLEFHTLVATQDIDEPRMELETAPCAGLQGCDGTTDKCHTTGLG